MKKWITNEILKATNGTLLFGDANRAFADIAIDSRKISPDALFVAIKGENHDGHDFAADVVSKGGNGLIIDKDKISQLPCAKWKENGIICIAVDDTTKALGDIAAFHRRRSGIKVVAITGSNGKTTTREMAAAVVSQRFKTLKPEKNFNNEIGVPLTLFQLSPSHECAVLELGMNREGEIRRLGEICEPDIGMITNIGPAHIGMLGSMEAIMRAKGELLERIKPEGTVVLNADDSRVLEVGNWKLEIRSQESGVRSQYKLLLFGISEKADIRAHSIQEDGTGISFTLVLPKESVSVRLGIPGNFMVSNALAAASVGYLLGLTGEEIARGIEAFKPVQGRMNIYKTSKGINLIDDTYNANLSSMEEALKTLRRLKGNNRGIFVTGDMFELGEYSEPMHKTLGELAACSGISKLFAIGKFAENVAAGARSEGMDFRDIFIGTKTEIINDLKKLLAPEDWVLVKGSRSMRMEEIVTEISK